MPSKQQTKLIISLIIQPIYLPFSLHAYLSLLTERRCFRFFFTDYWC